MVKNMLYFIVLILVVLVSFGVCNQSIKYPNEDWDWRQASLSASLVLVTSVAAPAIVFLAGQLRLCLKCDGFHKLKI